LGFREGSNNSNERKKDKKIGTIPKKETLRNEALIKDYLLKEDGRWIYSIAELGAMYAREEDGKKIPLTSTRIHQILSKYGITKGRKKRNRSGKNKK